MNRKGELYMKRIYCSPDISLYPGEELLTVTSSGESTFDPLEFDWEIYQ